MWDITLPQRYMGVDSVILSHLVRVTKTDSIAVGIMSSYIIAKKYFLKE